MRWVFERTIARLEQERAKYGAKLAYSEKEAAALVGVAYHVLRDARLDGQITASRIVGRRIRYTLEDIQMYLRSHREND